MEVVFRVTLNRIELRRKHTGVAITEVIQRSLLSCFPHFICAGFHMLTAGNERRFWQDVVSYRLLRCFARMCEFDVRLNPEGAVYVGWGRGTVVGS